MLSDVEKAIYSYNHLVENLNIKCEEVVEDLIGANNNVLDVRCIGSNPLNKNSENSVAYTSNNLNNIPDSDWSVYSTGSFNGILKDTDTNYIEDRSQMSDLGISASDNNKSYWIPSRYVIEDMDNGSFTDVFAVLEATEDGTIWTQPGLWNGCIVLYVRWNAVEPFSNIKKHGIRPVITVASGILDNASGSGTSSDPYVIQ